MDIFSTYRVHLFDSSANSVTRTIVFSQSQDQEEPEDNPNIIKSQQWILPDDSIQTIKMKIAKALGTNPHPDSMYLFSRKYISAKDFDPEKIYQELTKKSTTELTVQNIQAFLNNFSLKYQIQENDLNNLYQLLEKIHKEMETNQFQGVLQYFPIGFQYAHFANEYTFPVKPYDAPQEELAAGASRQLIPYDYHLLMRYPSIFQNEIYVCFSQNVEPAQRPIYFPRIGQIPTDIDPRIIDYDLAKQDTYQMFYQVYQDSMTKDFPLKMRKSIQGFTIVMKNRIRLPLEMIFKNISTDTLLPGIIYNPGKYKESILRLYSNRISKTGKRIPILNRSQIVNALKYTKNGTITYFLPRFTEEEVALTPNSPILDADLFIRLDSNGNLYIHCENEIPNIAALDQYVAFRLNPLLQKINGFLQKSGYELSLYDSIKDSNIGIKYYHESWVMKTPPGGAVGADLVQRIPCITDLFDVYEDDGKQIVMKYKRVFNEEEAQGHLIREMQQRKYEPQQIVDALKRNYGMTETRANDRISRYEIEHQARSLFFSPNKEYSFPLEISLNPQQMRIDLFKYCRDCGRLPKEEDQEYVVGPKGRIHRRFNKMKLPVDVDLPDFSYYALFQMYVNSLLDILVRPIDQSILAKCSGRRGEVPTTTQEESPQPPLSIPIESIPQVDLEAEMEDVDIEPEMETAAEIPEEPAASPTKTMRPPEAPVAEESEYETEGEEEEDSDEEEEDEEDDDMFYVKKRGGGPKAKAAPKVTKLSILQQKEPAMFSFKDERIGTYSRICQKEKQPVILDQEDYESAKRLNPNLKAIHYKNPASVHSQKYWYTCPKYWCALTNSVITEEEYQAGVCADHVITNSRYLNPSFLSTDKHPDSLCLPCCFEGDIESKPMHRNRIKDCQGVTPPPPEEMPKSAATATIPETPMTQQIPIKIPHPPPSASMAPSAPATPLIQKEDRNILRYTQSPPITKDRWGLLPRIMELFFNIDYSKVIVRTPLKTTVEPNKPTLLLYGIEHPKRQSFLGLMAEIYRQRTKTALSVLEYRQWLIQQITLDRFIQMHNGSMISVFGDAEGAGGEAPRDGSLLGKFLNMEDPLHRTFYEKVARAHANFIAYLTDPATQIDHQYLWELVSTDPENPLNLVIFEMTQDNKVDILCPPTANSFPDTKKETMFVLKRDNFYEPIYQFYDEDGTRLVIRRTFQPNRDFMPNSSIRRIFDIVQSSVEQNCRPKLLEGEGAKMNHDAAKLREILDKSGYMIQNQVWNLAGKLVGFYVKKQGTSTIELFVPCFPSAPILDIAPIRFIVDTILQKSYRDTWKAIQLLLQDSDHEVLVEPTHKIVHEDEKLDDGTSGGFRRNADKLPEAVWRSLEMVMGIRTETGQTIPVTPTPVTEIENQEYDLPSTEQADEIAADRIIGTNPQGDPTRAIMMRNIVLETQFYQVFRSLLRQLLNNFGNIRQKRAILERLKQYERDQATDYENALKSVAISLYEISKEYVEFTEYTDAQLDQIVETDLYGCYQEVPSAEGAQGEAIYCRGRTLVIPKYSLLETKKCTGGVESAEDCSNKNIYYMRLADELLRFRRIQLFMFQRQTFLNITSGMNEYHLSPKEILLLESSFTEDYFQDMIPFNVSSYIHQTNYDTAIPYEIMSNMDLYQPAFSLKDQEQFVRQIRPEVKSRMEMPECLVQTEGGRHPVMGNNRSSWYRSFPKGTEEYFFRDDSPECTFAAVANTARLAGLPPKTIPEIKADLWRGYERLLKVPGNQPKILAILRDQNKRPTTSDLQTMITVDDYYLTDFDIWVLMSYWKLPAVLFSTGRIKMADAENWLFLCGEEPETMYEPLVFIRSPRMVEAGKYPMYSVIVPRYRMNEVGEMGRIMESSQDGSRNTQSIMSLLDNMQLVTIKRRGRVPAT